VGINSHLKTLKTITIFWNLRSICIWCNGRPYCWTGCV